jgi:putative heme-binding domain-containing protein
MHCFRSVASCFCLLFLLSVLHAQDEAIPALTENSPLDPPEENIELKTDSLFIDKEKEQGIVKRIYAATEDCAAAKAALVEIGNTATELELRALRNLDRELSPSAQQQHKELISLALPLMAISGDETTLQYLHKVFDSQPERRAEIATAIAKLALIGKRRPHDWPLLVRSLTVANKEQTAIIVRALLRYRERATNPTIHRNLMIVAMELEGESLQHALKLLAMWAHMVPREIAAPTPQAELTNWIDWYKRTYPQLPPPLLPQDEPGSVHSFVQLTSFVYENHGDAAKGAVIFEKALCIKCHHVREKGEKIGPELTKVVQRLTKREIVESMLFPSHQILDNYITKRIVLKDGKILSGMVGERAEGYTVLQPNAEKIIVAKDDVEEMLDSPLSAMPTGLLNSFQPTDVADLIAFLKAAATD